MKLNRAQELADLLQEALCNSQNTSSSLISQRQILEQIYKDLLSEVPRSFNGLFARMQYYHDTEQVPNEIMGQVSQLRLIANRAAHEQEAQIDPSAALAGALSIISLLKHLVPDFEHPQLGQILKNAKPFPEKQQSAKQSFACVLRSWKHHINAGQIRGLELEAITDTGIEVKILLRDDQRNQRKAKFSTLMPSLWRYANLHCHHLSEVAGKTNYFIDNPRTLIVLEPDFLVDASSIAECMSENRSHPELYVLGRLFDEASSEKKLLGKLANSIFDDLILNPHQDFLELFKKGLQDMSIPMASLGLQASKRIYDELEQVHQPVIRDFCSEIRKHELLLEPSFMCPAYGLQGRLDLLYHQKKKLSIVELKSGRSHPYDVWPSQRYQVVAYNMIIRNAYTDHKLGTRSIFYSAEAEKSLRNIANIPLLEQNLIHCRNRIVGIMRLLSNEPQVFFDWLIKQSGVTYSPYSQEKLQSFKRLVSGIREFEYLWFKEQVKRVSREIWQVKLGADNASDRLGHNALWQKSRTEKEGKLIADLKIKSHDQQGLELALTQEPGATDFREGDIVLLYQQDREIDKQEIMRGSITEIRRDSIQIMVRGGIHRSLLADQLWTLEHDLIEGFLYAPYSALTTFLQMDQDRRDLFLGLREPQMGTPDSFEEEKEQVLSRMRVANELYLVQGPPGTGKTSGLIGSYVENSYFNTEHKLVILSFTNRAVDEICNCLKARGIPFLRTGHSAAIKDELLSNKVQGARFQEIEKLLTETRIYVSTVHSAARWHRDLGSICHFDEMIIDEASQILESSILGLVNLAPKCIFIGDQNQLPAISVQTPLSYNFDHEALNSLFYDSINQSLMERLYRVYKARNWMDHCHMLTGHYRMHREIAGLVSHYYEDKLRAILPRQSEALPDLPIPRYLQKRLLWVECPPADKDFFDPRQVAVVKAVVDQLCESSAVINPTEEIGIVAPYRVMIHALRKQLPNIAIDTVERYQGSERDVIILCLPLRSFSALGSMQALSNDGRVDRKLNVAISRAKQRLIIIANSDILRQSTHYQRLYEGIQEAGAIATIDDIIN